jgi:two-component system, NarL family, nitrate/nitrite response regulator NarL
MTPASPERIVLVEDHSLFAEALETTLVMKGYDAHRVPLTAGQTAAQLADAVLRLRPRTVLLDLDLGPFGSGLTIIKPLTTAGIDVIVVTACSDRARWGEAVLAGARKVLAKNTPMSDVVATIRRAAGGLPLMSDGDRQALIREWRLRISEQQDLLARLARLTPRESEVLSQLMVGCQVGEIAREFYVSESTVRTQVKSILAKLQVSSQLAAVGLANRVGWSPRHSPRLVM